MRKVFCFFAFIVMSLSSFCRTSKLVWVNDSLLYGSLITSLGELPYHQTEGMGSLVLPRVLIKEVYLYDTIYLKRIVRDTIIVHDTVFVGIKEPALSRNIGSFSVSPTKRITFSAGNLQYNQRNAAWRFAEKQTDLVGLDNENISSQNSGWIDLFGWGCCMNPTITSVDYMDYQSFIDWGTIKIGSDSLGLWRTLTSEEWDYLYAGRENSDSLCGIAQVDGVNGLILLPDNWVCPDGVVFKSGLGDEYGSGYYATYQTFTPEQWSMLESSGAVFLPAAGNRSGKNLYNVQYGGCYWSSSELSKQFAYTFTFYSDGARVENSYRYYGRSVRLVKDL